MDLVAVIQSDYGKNKPVVGEVWGDGNPKKVDNIIQLCYLKLNEPGTIQLKRNTIKYQTETSKQQNNTSTIP